MVWTSGGEFKRLFEAGVGRTAPGEPSDAAWTRPQFEWAYGEACRTLRTRRGESASPFPADDETLMRWMNGASRIQTRFRSAILTVFFGPNEDQQKTSALSRAWAQDDVQSAHRRGLTPLAAGAGGHHYTNHFTSLDDGWVGRSDPLERLREALSADCRLLVLLGMPGIGKTALGERLSLVLAEASPDRFAYHKENLDNQSAPSGFIAVALRWLASWGETPGDEIAADPDRLIGVLVAHLSRTRRLIQIDSLERLLTQEEGAEPVFRDPLWAGFLAAFLKAESGLGRIIATSQVVPAELLRLGTRVQTKWRFERVPGLPPHERMDLFARAGLEAAGAHAEPLTRIGEGYHGHPLALRIIAGEILAEPFSGDVGAWWAHFGAAIQAVEQALQDALEGATAGDDDWAIDRFTRALKQHVRSRLDDALARLRAENREAYVMLCEAAIYRTPVPEAFWLAHLSGPDVSDTTRLTALDAVKDRLLVDLVLVNGAPGLKLHNLVRSVALDHLRALGEQS